MSGFADQYDRVVAWMITGLLSLVTFLVGWIFKQNLDAIADRFTQMENLFNERLKQSERVLLARLDQQDEDLKIIEGSFERLHDRLDDDARAEHSRRPPRGSIRDRGRKPDQDKEQDDSSSAF